MCQSQNFIKMDNTKGIGRAEHNTPSIRKGKKHILGIGINDYTHWSKLRNATNDLDDVVKILMERYDFDTQHLTLLKDEDATRKNIVNKLHHFTNLNVLGEDDSLLIYFSGHGFLDENEEGYWVPVDSEKDDIDSFIPNLTIQSKIKNMKCRHVLLISDSCFSGSLMAKGERSASVETLVADELELKKSRWIITSGGRDETVSDGFGKNSPFAEAIISELKHNSKSQFIVDELAMRVRNITRSNATQMPQVEKMFQAGDLGGRFIFCLKNNEAAEWENLDKNSISALENFKKQYPNSILIVEADKTIQKLKKEETEREHTVKWERTKRINTADAYLDFWQKHNHSPYRIEARERLAEAEDHEEWQRTPYTRAGMLNYLDKFPKGLHSSEVEIALDAFLSQNKERERLEREKKEQEQAEKDKAETEKADKDRLENIQRDEREKKLLLEKEAALHLARDKEAIRERARKEQEIKERQEQIQKFFAANEIPTQDSAVSEPSFWQQYRNTLIFISICILGFFIWLEIKPHTSDSKLAEDISKKDPFDGQMVFVEGGTFNMGSDDGEADEKPVHSVTVSSFNMGKYEVTQAQWQSIMGNNPSYFKGDNLPVENVSWVDIQEFLIKLNEKTGKKYRLPTEAEWEFAARGGKFSKSYNYSGSYSLENVAWYKGNSENKTHSIGNKKENELGIFDMSGNVWEWCSDCYSNYSSDSVFNPTGSIFTTIVCFVEVVGFMALKPVE